MVDPSPQACQAVAPEDRAELLALDAKINALLPPQYQNRYDDVSRESMGSAELKFGADGKVAWNEIWTSYCDLALAGGPAHRGTLLEPGALEQVRAEAEKYQQVVEEIGRGLWLVTGLPILPRIAPGWVGVICHNERMAAWLVRAIIAENIWVRYENRTLYLPAGPHFRLAKEVKNVVTVLAKTCHYWTGHMPEEQRAAVDVSPFLEAALPEEVHAAPEEIGAVVRVMEQGIAREAGLRTVPSRTLSWVGVQCDSDNMAVWLMRGLIAENVLARREENVLYLPASPKFACGDRLRKVVETFARVHGLWDIRRMEALATTNT